jgi:hypothetical protein
MGILIFITFSINAQQKKIHNALSLDLGGKTVYYSLNHEILFNFKPSVQIVASYGTGYLQDNSFKNLAIPIYGGFIFGNKHALEIGIGIVFNYLNDNRKSFFYPIGYQTRVINYQFYSNLWIGYRWQFHKNFFLKAGVCPIFNFYQLKNSSDNLGEYKTKREVLNRGIGLKSDEFLFWGGVGFGYKF